MILRLYMGEPPCALRWVQEMKRNKNIIRNKIASKFV